MYSQCTLRVPSTSPALATTAAEEVDLPRSGRPLARACSMANGRMAEGVGADAVAVGRERRSGRHFAIKMPGGEACQATVGFNK